MFNAPLKKKKMLQLNLKTLLTSSSEFLFCIIDRALLDLFRQICFNQICNKCKIVNINKIKWLRYSQNFFTFRDEFSE